VTEVEGQAGVPFPPTAAGVNGVSVLPHRSGKKETTQMNTSMTIEAFHALMADQEQENAVIAALRKLMNIQKPEEIEKLGNIVYWGWKW